MFYNSSIHTVFNSTILSPTIKSKETYKQMLILGLLLIRSISCVNEHSINPSNTHISAQPSPLSYHKIESLDPAPVHHLDKLKIENPDLYARLLSFRSLKTLVETNLKLYGMLLENQDVFELLMFLLKHARVLVLDNQEEMEARYKLFFPRSEEHEEAYKTIQSFPCVEALLMRLDEILVEESSIKMLFFGIGGFFKSEKDTKSFTFYSKFLGGIYRLENILVELILKQKKSFD